MNILFILKIINNCKDYMGKQHGTLAKAGKVIYF
jgi:hypothetical protein